LLQDHAGQVLAISGMLASADTPSHSDMDDAETADSDDEGVDLLGSSKRSASNSDNESNPSSPQKVPNSQSTPPRHTARSLLSPKTPSLASQTSQLTIHSPLPPVTQTSDALMHDASSTAPSQISDVSNIDLAAYVRKQCRSNESRLRAHVDVVGDVSSDERSEVTGSAWLSSQRTTSVSEAPSLFSTGSLHSHAIPSDHDMPKCKCLRSMRFFCFHETNHTCDGTACAQSIPAGAFGWHCADCDVDLCTNCFPINFTPVNSFDDSLGSVLSSDAPPPSDDRAAPRLQEGADAAASRLGAQ
jgi:hypothetical protein